VVELIGLEKAYGGRAVLSGADLRVEGGEAVALVGGNGSGKTTTLRCIAGLARPDRGTVRVDGVDVLSRPREALERLSYLPQRPAFPGTLSVREVIGLAARLRRQRPRAVDRELERCGLAHVADRFVAQLSGGERQRVGLAVTFVADVRVFIFDEPSASLDPLAARMLVERARELRRDGRAVLYTTHVAADIDALATRVALLRNGGIDVLDDLELRDEPPAAARPRTAGERALERLEVRDDAEIRRLDDGRVGAGGGLWERSPRAAAAAAGPR
jgi:ABC-type multidrug transport system ATPase subunit